MTNRILHVYKNAPEKPDFYPGFRYNDEKTCISPSGWSMEGDIHKHYNYRCCRTGTIKTDKGMLCGTHAKVWARRGYINTDHLREILKELAIEKAAKAAARVKCLTAGKCL